MKLKNFLSILFIALSLISVASCSDDDKEEVLPAAPAISNVELGIDNSKVGYTGTDIHVEADIKSVAGLKSVKVQITPATDGSAWYVFQTYEADSLKDFNLHKHFDIDEKAKVGTYDVLIVATDLAGQRTVFREKIEVIKDPTLPTAKSEGSTYADNLLTVKAKIAASNGLKSIVVTVKNKTVTLDGSEVEGKTSYDLNAEIPVTELANGHYHFFVTITDLQGKVFSYEDHFDKK